MIRLPTEFAPAERESREEILRQHEAIQKESSSTYFNTLPNIVLILNDKRQIIYANTQTLALMGIDTVQPLLGRRPGEAFGCIHASESAGGCGTTEHCRTCGAVLAILAGIEGRKASMECSILKDGADGPEGAEFHVTATPIEHEGERFVFFSLEDIGDRKRRRALERIFFHDVLNLAGGSLSMLTSLTEELPSESRKDAEGICLALRRLVSEINAQRLLLAAEQNELAPEMTTAASGFLLKSMLSLAVGLVEEPCCALVIDPDSEDVSFKTDVTLLHRVLLNMVKNAVEASSPRMRVTLGCRADALGLTFWVHNETAMPREVALQVFKRSFSTKGLGRGLGTYSIKLLGERYLGGRASFTSDAEAGTIFSLRLPYTPSRVR